jgi:hypothetical protein
MFVKKPVLPVLAVAFVCVDPAAADDIALSLVHGQDRIDIPVSAITRIEAHATQTFTFADTRESRTYPFPGVDLCYTAEIQEQICRLTGESSNNP